MSFKQYLSFEPQRLLNEGPLGVPGKRCIGVKDDLKKISKVIFKNQKNCDLFCLGNRLVIVETADLRYPKKGFLICI